MSYNHDGCKLFFWESLQLRILYYAISAEINFHSTCMSTNKLFFQHKKCNEYLKKAHAKLWIVYIFNRICYTLWNYFYNKIKVELWKFSTFSVVAASNNGKKNKNFSCWIFHFFISRFSVLWISLQFHRTLLENFI